VLEQRLDACDRDNAWGWPGPEGGLRAWGWLEHPGFLVDHPGGDQPVSGGSLVGAVERAAGALTARASEHAVKDAGGDRVERIALLAQTAPDLGFVDDRGARRERVGVMSGPLERLSGVHQPRLESS
jgi:hypothetical protein